MVGESMVLLKVTSMNFIFEISKEIKWKVKVVLLELSSINFILGISKEMKWKVKGWCYTKYRGGTSFL